MNDFVGRFMKYTSEYESPSSFFKWAAYTTIAAVLKDNVYIPQGSKQLYPNIYVILVASSAIHRKSVPTRLVSDLVFQIGNTKLIKGRSSIQGVIDTLANIFQNKQSNERLSTGAGVICSEELAAFIVQDDSTIPLLTDFYEFYPRWEENLRGRGMTTIKNLCLSMIAASNETFLEEVYNDRALYGGLLGRTFIIKANEFRPANSLLGEDDNLEAKYNMAPLLESLRDISKLKGRFTLDTGVKQEYDKWYISIHDSNKNKADRTGAMGRIHTGVLKLSMILGAARNVAPVIKLQDLDEAITTCLDTLSGSSMMALGRGKSPDSQVGMLLLTALYGAPGFRLSQRDILFAHWQDFDQATLQELVSRLELAGMLQVFHGGNSQVEYLLTSKAIQLIRETESSKVRSISV